ncbi:hypothetical protein WN71_018550 [Streptomyces mangrovisoli]|uniref:Uncharacterized protein n=1 Tax=Streptomyces mangrovisoli TaxID=1428628 RepID=A0A1J4NVD7_9ACTN|nr:hypothetical protein WN71_018550 [Streptomyces mangrovisoli]
MPPRPPGPPPAPADGWRAAAVALLNLSGLGLGYVLLRRWIGAAVCWAATIVLLLVALPADADGVSGTALVAYAVLLVLAAVHGAVVGLRTRLVWPGRAPLAALLGLVLLAVPVGGGVLYDRAHDEAIQQMLLDRLDKADQLVADAGERPFSSAESSYRSALHTYSGLVADHPDSRAAGKVSDRMTTFYETVGAAYDKKQYCDAIPALKYLRKVPDTLPKKQLGSLVTWPDDRLATSLYECGASDLTSDGSAWAGQFGDLLATFPESDQAGKVEPAVGSAVTKAAKGVHGSDPCTAVDRLKGLSSQIGSLSGAKAQDALDADASRADRSASTGGYACGVDQYKDGDFDSAMTTLNDFVDANKHDKNAARAKKIVIAAEIAKTTPAAGKHLPTTASGGSISVTVENDSPDEITVLYTGPVTGSFTLKACGSCRSYSLSDTLVDFKPCSSGKNYPKRTISLPAGTTYFLHKPKGDSVSTPGSDTAKLRSGYIYTECAYVTQGFGTSSG